VEGDFYVDKTCIDCDTCRWMVPSVFSRVGDQSAVHFQPQSSEERLKALQALLSCPTASIHTTEKARDIKEAHLSMPIHIADNVYHCGYHSEKSFGAASYLILRPEGNILIDCPRYAAPLVKRLEELGGVRYLLITHKDDVADHAKYHEHFKCERVLHVDEVTSRTGDVETKIEGIDEIQFLPDIKIIVVPGHTKGSCVFLYKDKFLFSGDHLAWSPSIKQLIAFRRACWYSWPEQIKSMQRLQNYSFEYVLPGHGQRASANRDQMADDLDKCVKWMISLEEMPAKGHWMTLPVEA